MSSGWQALLQAGVGDVRLQLRDLFVGQSELSGKYRLIHFELALSLSIRCLHVVVGGGRGALSSALIPLGHRRSGRIAVEESGSSGALGLVHGVVDLQELRPIISLLSFSDLLLLANLVDDSAEAPESEVEDGGEGQERIRRGAVVVATAVRASTVAAVGREGIGAGPEKAAEGNSHNDEVQDVTEPAEDLPEEGKDSHDDLDDLQEEQEQRNVAKSHQPCVRSIFRKGHDKNDPENVNDDRGHHDCVDDRVVQKPLQASGFLDSGFFIEFFIAALWSPFDVVVRRRGVHG